MKVKDFLKQIEEMGLTGDDEISFEVEHMIKMIKLPQKETETTLKETIENIVNTKGVNKEHGELE